MARQEATFRDRVNVWRIIPNSQSDQLTCELLTIHFAPKRENAAKPASAGGVKKKLSLADLEPQWIRRGRPGGARFARPRRASQRSATGI